MAQYLMAWINLHFGTDEEEGQGLVEYALILVLISIAAIATMRLVGTSVNGVFSTINTALGQ